MADGPTSGTTCMPSWCARLTRLAPGSAMAGQPASESRPTLLPFSSQRVSRSRSSGLECSSSTSNSSSCNGNPNAFRNWRADFGCSTSNLRKGNTVLRTCEPTQSVELSAARSAGIRKSFLFGISIQRRPDCASGNQQILIPEHFRQRDQRQADQCRGVGRLDAFGQRDAQTFRLCAAGAIVCRLCLEVAPDFTVVQPTETDLRWNELRLLASAGRIDQCHRGDETDGLSAL